MHSIPQRCIRSYSIKMQNHIATGSFWCITPIRQCWPHLPSTIFFMVMHVGPVCLIFLSVDIHHQFNLSNFKETMSELEKCGFGGVVFPKEKNKKKEMSNAGTTFWDHTNMPTT